jgi:hypothetical protein
MAAFDPLQTLKVWLMLPLLSIRAKPLTIAFYVVFALWFTATRYSSPAFYGWLLAPAVVNILALGTVGLSSFLLRGVVSGQLRSLGWMPPPSDVR